MEKPSDFALEIPVPSIFTDEKFFVIWRFIIQLFLMEKTDKTMEFPSELIEI